MADRPTAVSHRASGGLDILLDAKHTDQRHGTGISTYARNLAAGVRALGHSVSWLSGASAPRTPDPLADAVSLSDAPPEARGLRLQAATAGHMLGAVTSPKANARWVPNEGLTLDRPGYSRTGETYLASNLFVRAHYRHMLLRQFTEVRIPVPMDVLHLTGPLPVKMNGVRTVTTIHDLIPIRAPWTTPDNKAEFIDRVRTAARISDLIITVSETSKADIVQILGVDPDKVAVTYQPTELQPLGPGERSALPRTLHRYGLKEDEYALFVGALEPKKNLRRLIEAFLEVDTSLPLVVVGPRSWMWEEELAPLNATLGDEARKRLRILGFLPSDDIRMLYGGARAFLFPSIYEGFGLPALEALALGRPTLVSQIGALKEVCGDAAVYVDPLDRKDIRDRIGSILHDASLRASLSRRAADQARKFSFEAYVNRLKTAYAKLD